MNKFFKIGLLIFIMCFSHGVLSNTCFRLPNHENDNFIFQNDISVLSYDDVEIAANIFIPKSPMPANGYPTIIFVSSWSLHENEYFLKARQLAEDDYVVLSYAPRGFGCSGGEADVAGPRDINDLSSVVDYLLSLDVVDEENIGVSGISYGAGIALLGVAKDSRIKTAVSMSGWGSLSESLYGQQTGRLFWSRYLSFSGNAFGTLSEEIFEILDSLLAHRDMDRVLAWSKLRSPLTYVDLINERATPIFISHNYGDNLFHVNSLMEFFELLDGPKYFELNQGTHASTEIPGLAGLENETWDNAHRWMDHWLKDNGESQFDTSQVSILTDIENDREMYSALPTVGNHTRAKTYYFEARENVLQKGTLNELPNGSRSEVVSIFSGVDSGASTGIPALSAILDGHFNAPVVWNPSFTLPLHGLTFISEPLHEQARIRGIPKINLSLSSSGEYLLAIAYLYDVDENGVGSLITHGPVSRHGIEPGQRLDTQMELVATAHDVPAGHSIAVVVDTFDLL